MPARRSLRHGIAAAAETYKDILLHRRQLKEENEQAANRISMGLGPSLAALGQRYSNAELDPEQAQAQLEAIIGPLKQFGGKPPDFNLEAFRPSQEDIAGPVFDKLTPDTTLDQILMALKQRPGGEGLTQPTLGQMPEVMSGPGVGQNAQEPVGGNLPSKIMGPVQNPMVNKLQQEVQTRGAQEERAAERQFARGERQKEIAHPAELNRAADIQRQNERIGLEFLEPKNEAILRAQRAEATDKTIREAKIQDQIRVDAARQKLEQQYGSVRPTESLKIPNDITIRDKVIPAGSEGILFYDYAGNVVGFIPGTPTGNPMRPDPRMEMLKQLGISPTPSHEVKATPSQNIEMTPEEKAQFLGTLRKRGLVKYTRKRGLIK